MPFHARPRWRPIAATALAAVVVGGVLVQRSLSGPGGTGAEAAAETGERAQRVSFPRGGDRRGGRLTRAAGRRGPAPAVAILGPMTFVKEQAPTLYAQRLSRLGYTALIFDERFRGESGGEPRNYEDPEARGEDLRAAIDYLASRDDVDGTQINVLGICMGSNQAITVSAGDARVNAVAVTASHLRTPEADGAWLGSDEAVAQRLERGRAALAQYERTGEVDYVPAVDRERTDVGMPGVPVWEWYQPWADRGIWQNQYAVMSDAAMFGGYETLTSAQRMDKPFLMIHSNLSALPDIARQHFDAVPTPDKRLLWEGDTPHLRYYDQPDIIDRTAGNVAAWFRDHA